MTKKYSHIFNSTNKRIILLNPYRHYGSVIDNEDRSYHLNSSNHYAKSYFYTENFSKYYDTRFIDDSIRQHKFVYPIEDLFDDDDF